MGLSFHSTNHGTGNVDFKTALLAGLAPDKGLYTADSYPTVSRDQLIGFADLTYPELGFKWLSRLIGDQVPGAVLRRVCADAYNFPVPAMNVHDNVHVLHLDKGPTASFKDFAARTMARLMQHYTSIEGKELLILTATSGDTGGAVASAFYGVKNINVVVLFPEKEVSERQRRQMTTLGGNVAAVAIDGKFDDCQALVKQAFADPAMAHLHLSSANSINVGRLLPQSVYYVWAYLRVMADRVASGVLEPVNISVPSGNFGNLMGGLIAKQMGLPVDKFIAAVNENDEVPAFLETSTYKKIVPSRSCLSNAMNVGHPSNFARIIDLYGGVMDHDGMISKQPDMARLQRDIFACSVSDSLTKKIIRDVYKNHGYMLEAHGAVGYGGLARYLDTSKSRFTNITIETADPAKFPELIQEVLGIDPPLPRSLADMQNKEESFTRLERDYDGFKAFLLRGY
nr:threonine synthase [Candidatus Sigynarchaeota archaeon]